MPYTLYDKIWNDHLVHQQEDGTTLLFVDRHLIHEVTSPQAFEGLRNSSRKVRQPNLTLAVADHNVPTTDRTKGISDEESKLQVDTLEKNCNEFGIKLSVQINLSLNQFFGAYIILSSLLFSQAPHQLKLLFAIILHLHRDIKCMS